MTSETIRKTLEAYSSRYFGPHEHGNPRFYDPEKIFSRNILCEWRSFCQCIEYDGVRHMLLDHLDFCAYKHHGLSREEFEDIWKVWHKKFYKARSRFYMIVDKAEELQKELELYMQPLLICTVVKKCMAIIGMKATLCSGKATLYKSELDHYWLKTKERMIDVTYNRDWGAICATYMKDYKELSNPEITIEAVLSESTEVQRKFYETMVNFANYVKGF